MLQGLLFWGSTVWHRQSYTLFSVLTAYLYCKVVCANTYFFHAIAIVTNKFRHSPKWNPQLIPGRPKGRYSACGVKEWACSSGQSSGWVAFYMSERPSYTTTAHARGNLVADKALLFFLSVWSHYLQWMRGTSAFSISDQNKPVVCNCC